MVTNDLLPTFAVSLQQAQDWVDYNVQRYVFPGGVSIK